MPRGRAADTLPDDLAAKVREAIAQARELKGLKNERLATHLKWDNRQVTNAMQADQPLRLPKAKALLDAVRRLKPPRRLPPEARSEVEMRAATILGVAGGAIATYEHERFPAALIATGDLAPLAKWIADRIVKKPGFSERKRADLERVILSILNHGAEVFAGAADQRLMGMADTERAYVLSCFGWEFHVQEGSPDSQYYHE